MTCHGPDHRSPTFGGFTSRQPISVAICNNLSGLPAPIGRIAAARGPVCYDAAIRMRTFSGLRRSLSARMTSWPSSRQFALMPQDSTTSADEQ